MHIRHSLSIKSVKSISIISFYSNQNQLNGTSDVHYLKSPYIGNLSRHIKNNLSKLCKYFFKENFNIKVVCNSLQIKNNFSYRDSIPDDLKSFLEYKFTCASCSSSYIGGAYCHLSALIIGIFYCLNYGLVLLHLIIIHTASPLPPTPSISWSKFFFSRKIRKQKIFACEEHMRLMSLFIERDISGKK